MWIKNNFPKASGVNLEVTQSENETPKDIPPQEDMDIPISRTDSLVITLSSQGQSKYKNYCITVKSPTSRSVKITDQDSVAGEKIFKTDQLAINIPPDNTLPGDEKDDVSIGPEPPGE